MKRAATRERIEQAERDGYEQGRHAGLVEDAQMGEALRAALALAHSMLHNGEPPSRQSEDIIHAALLTTATTRSSGHVRPARENAMNAAERKSLKAAVHYWIERGDNYGVLTGSEGWVVAESVVAGLLSGEVRHTSSIPEPGFSVEVLVNRLSASHPHPKAVGIQNTGLTHCPCTCCNAEEHMDEVMGG